MSKLNIKEIAADVFEEMFPKYQNQPMTKKVLSELKSDLGINLQGKISELYDFPKTNVTIIPNNDIVEIYPADVFTALIFDGVDLFEIPKFIIENRDYQRYETGQSIYEINSFNDTVEIKRKF